jgi:lysophospholipase L1-like esterase
MGFIPTQPKFVPPKVVSLLPNDVVVFAGDSVTFLGAKPGGWIQTFNQFVQQNMVGGNIHVIASGVGGNTAAQLEARLSSTVLNFNPTVVVVFIGINDVVRLPKNPDGTRSLVGYQATIEDIVKKCLNHPTVRTVVLMTPMAIGDKYDGEGRFDSSIDAMAQTLRNFASLNNLPLIDVRQVIVSGEPLHNPMDIAFGVYMDHTLVHPTAFGAQVLAGTALMSFGQ